MAILIHVFNLQMLVHVPELLVCRTKDNTVIGRLVGLCWLDCCVRYSKKRTELYAV